MTQPVPTQPQPTTAKPVAATGMKVNQPSVAKAVDWAAFDARLASSSLGGKARQVDRAKLYQHLTNRVRGQDEQLEIISRGIANGYAKSTRIRPVYSVMLLGPPGVGKTETAKAVAEGVFGSETDLLLLNGSDYKNPGESMHKLCGVGAAYQGSDKGGELTRPLMGKPEKTVCWDECEKSARETYDVLLAALGDGKIKEAGTNKVVDCTRSIWILTSNLEHERAAEVYNSVTDHEERCKAFKSLIEPHGFRPEILDRVTDYIYYRPLPARVMAEVIAQKLIKLSAEYDLVCTEIAVEAVFQLLSDLTKNSGGVRAMMYAAERRLGDGMVEAKQSGSKAIRIDAVDGKLVVIPA